MASPRSNSSLSRQSSSSSRPGHPMSAGSFMLHAKEEPIHLTHTNFTSAAPLTPPPPAPPPPSPPAPPSTLPAENPVNVWKVRCLVYAALLFAFVGLCLIVAGIAFQIDSSAATSKRQGFILLAVGIILLLISFIVCGLFYALYKRMKEKAVNSVVLTSMVKPRSQEDQERAILQSSGPPQRSPDRRPDPGPIIFVDRS